MHLFCFFLTLLRRLTKMLKAHVFLLLCAALQSSVRSCIGSLQAVSMPIVFWRFP